MAPEVEDLKLIGGNLALDFVNTVDCRSVAERRERLAGYRDLVDWSRHAGAISASEAARLLAKGRQAPDAARAALGRAIALREGLYRLFMAAIGGTATGTRDLATLNAALSQGLSEIRLAPTPDGFELGWAQESESLDRVLWPIARAAAELLASEDARSRLRHCAGSDCDWLFLDYSRNRSRRWCIMEECGNRAKARRFYAQHKKRVRPAPAG